MSLNKMAKRKNLYKSEAPEKTEKKSKRVKSKTATTKFKLNSKTKRIIGLSLALICVYLFIAFISYLFSGKMDQDKVEGANFLTFVFTNQPFEIVNWLGKLGAIVSHRIIFNGFGFMSFLIPIFLGLVSIKILFNVIIYPIKKALKIGVVALIWGSIFFGYFFSQSNLFMGGNFGYQINQWLGDLVGEVGTFFLLLFSFSAITGVMFNTIFQKIGTKVKQWLSHVEKVEKQETTADSVSKYEVEMEKDLISEEEIEIVETEVEIKVEEVSESGVELSTEIPKSEDKKEASGDDFEIEVETSKEEILTDKEINKKVSEFGEYDPELDLSSYQLPPIDLLDTHGQTSGISINKEELEENKNKIVETLSNYKIAIDKIKATVGPTVTLYEVIPAPGVRISKIKNLEDDIALSLSALGIRIIAPIPGKGTIGIEVPNSNPQIVSMKALIQSDKFQNSKFELPVALGKTISNETLVADLTKMPHLLMAGATGQGKSVGLNAILVSLLYKKHPSQVKFVLIDPKKVELTLFNKIERHFLAKLPGEEEAIITDTGKVVATLNSLCIEMDNRYDLLKDAQVRNIKEYNAKFIQRRLNPEKGHQYLPYIVLVIDEFADLIMTAGKEVETPIARIAQLARAIGIHLIVATQRPSVNVITGVIKANFPGRIAFRVTSKIDSRTILDAGGADQLIGRGDMIYSTGSEIIRLQCGFVDTPEVEKICNFIGEQRAYPNALLLPEYIDEKAASTKGGFDDEDRDEKFEEAARIIVIHQQGSASLLQRKLKLGYNRAGRIVDQLEAAGIIGPFEGSKARKVFVADEISLERLLDDL
jgi:S-DNA-T family DNA segregation ATPase FtsK/SpoIIIE|tara:strand:+ start:5039 stop:7498 length:2460 start_codon:yes stop_codon:yes gene_type:complete